MLRDKCFAIKAFGDKYSLTLMIKAFGNKFLSFFIRFIILSIYRERSELLSLFIILSRSLYRERERVFIMSEANLYFFTAVKVIPCSICWRISLAPFDILAVQKSPSISVTVADPISVWRVMLHPCTSTV